MYREHCAPFCNCDVLRCFDAKPATRFCTQLCLDSMRPELLRRRYGESDNDDDFEGNGMDSSEGDGEVDVEGEGE